MRREDNSFDGDYHLLYDDVLHGLALIFDRNRRFCNYDVDYGLRPGSDQSDTYSDSNHPVGSRLYEPMRVLIGTKSLKENMLDDGRVRDEDAVRVLMHGFHENAHVWERGIGYMRSGETATDAIKNMARNRALGICFPSYYSMSYIIDPAEISADLESVRGIRAFFGEMGKSDIRYGEIDLDGIVSSIARSRHGASWPDFMACRTAEDVEDAYGWALVRAPGRIRFDAPYLIGHCGNDPRMRKLLRNEGLVDGILSCRDGYAQTEMLCRYVGELYPDSFRSVPCIKDEYMVQNLRNYGESIASKLLRAEARFDDVPAERPGYGGDGFGF